MIPPDQTGPRHWLQIAADADSMGINLVAATDQTPAAFAEGLALPILTGLSTIQRPLSIPGIRPAPGSNLQADCDNSDGALTALWRQRPPLRRAARLKSGSDTLFSGIITALDAGANMRISLESGMDRPLSDNLPLRTSAIWGGWRDVRVLPWVWGKTTLAPIQYSDDQRVFLLADHPIEGVDEVQRDDIPTQSWAWYNGLDSTGRAVAFLELAMPLSDGERLSVTLRGRMHPDTGRLLQTPAEILHDLLANLARAPVQWSDLDDWRTETQDLVLGGLLDDNRISIRAAIDQLLQSAGAAWAAAMPGIATTWPPRSDPAAPATRIDPRNARDPVATTQASDITTVLRILYDYDHGGQRYRRAIQLQAPDAVKEYGSLELDWPAPWLRTPRHAEALGQRILSWLSRPRWRVTWRQSAAVPDILTTGAWVDMQHPLSPIQGRHRLINAELDLSSAEVACTIEAPVGDSRAIETTRLSTAFEPVIQAGITVEIGADEIIFWARDEIGQPLSGAKVTLDGGVTRIADRAGRVSFPTVRGRHILLIEADGYQATEVEIVV